MRVDHAYRRPPHSAPAILTENMQKRLKSVCAECSSNAPDNEQEGDGKDTNKFRKRPT